MIRLRSALGTLALLCLGVAAGWWGRGANRAVMAQRSSSHSTGSPVGEASLAFQLSGVGPETALTVYNPENHTLFVYPRIGSGNSSVNCAYSFTIQTPGAAIQRANCQVGELVPQR